VSCGPELRSPAGDVTGSSFGGHSRSATADEGGALGGERRERQNTDRNSGSAKIHCWIAAARGKVWLHSTPDFHHGLLASEVPPD
jgi:hypothetical protein